MSHEEESMRKCSLIWSAVLAIALLTSAPARAVPISAPAGLKAASAEIHLTENVRYYRHYRYRPYYRRYYRPYYYRPYRPYYYGYGPYYRPYYYRPYYYRPYWGYGYYPRPYYFGPRFYW
jgi:hypothetical protein